MSAAMFCSGAAGARELTALETKLRPEPISEARQNDHFGTSVAIDGDLMAVGVPDCRPELSRRGAVDVYRRQPDGSWEREAVLFSEDAQENGHLGFFVALDGDTLATSRRYTAEGSSDTAWSLHIFVRTEAGWIQEEEIELFTGAGYFLTPAVSGDRIAVGILTVDSETYETVGVVHVYRRHDSVWEFEACLTTEDPEEAVMFGRTVDIDANRMIVGSPLAMCASGERHGVVYVYENNGGNWMETARIEGRAILGSWGFFGHAVALEGDRLAAGQPGYWWNGGAHVFEHVGGAWEHTGTAGPEPGPDAWGMIHNMALSEQRLILSAVFDSYEEDNALFIFERGEDDWMQQTRLDMPAAESFWDIPNFDYDGAELCVGFPRFDGPSCLEQGRVCIYTESEEAWAQEAVLHRGDGILSDDDRFGNSVSVDGDWMLVGAPHDLGGEGECDGAVYVYQLAGDERQFLYKLRVADAWSGYGFGGMTALSADRAAITANEAVYVYRREGDELVFETCLPAPEDAQNSYFGCNVAIDGDRMIVGASRADVDVIENAGAAYVYAYSGGEWIEQARLTASDPVEDAYFGNAVALDGERALVGAYRGNEYRGAAYVFKESSGVWLEEARLAADDYGLSIWFGISVGIDGNTVAVGAPRVCNPGGADVGRVFVFSRDGEAWERTAVLRSQTPMANARFGMRLDIREIRMAIGAPSEDDDDMQSQGAAYLFHNNDGEWSQALRLVASDTHPYQYFGKDAVALDGTQLVVGAPFDGNGSWLMTGAVYCYDIACPGDVDGDWDVDLIDLTTLLSSYGALSDATRDCGDLDGDGDVDLSDLAIVLGCWGDTCP